MHGGVEVAGNAPRNDGAVRLVTRTWQAATNELCAGTRSARRRFEYVVGRALRRFGSRSTSAPRHMTRAHPIETRLDPPLQPGRRAGGLER